MLWKAVIDSRDLLISSRAHVWTGTWVHRLDQYCADSKSFCHLFYQTTVASQIQILSSYHINYLPYPLTFVVTLSAGCLKPDGHIQQKNMELTSWLMKTLKRSSGEVRNFSFRLNLQVGILTPVLTGAAVLLEDEICSTQQEQVSVEICLEEKPDGS